MQSLWSNGSGPTVNGSSLMVQLGINFNWRPSWVCIKVNTASSGQRGGHAFTLFVDDTKLGED